MFKIKFIRYLIVFMILSNNLQAQFISFNSILKGINEPQSDSFRKELFDNNFIMIAAYKNIMKPEIWAFNFNPNNGRADSWVHYNYDKSVYEKKNKKNVNVEIKIISYGANHMLNEYLKTKIKENCRYDGVSSNSIDYTHYDEYIHSTGTVFRIYLLDKHNQITIHNTIKLTNNNQK